MSGKIGPALRLAKKVATHVGPIHSTVAGRTDHLPMHVPHGSYVIPADIVGALGEGNSLNGHKQLKLVFGGQPYGGSKAAYGQQGTTGYGQGNAPYGEESSAPYDGDLPGSSAGGARHDGGPGHAVPIVAAGGEYVVPPELVNWAGDGDPDLGQEVLDEYVKRWRRKTIKTLKNLPGPKRD